MKNKFDRYDWQRKPLMQLRPEIVRQWLLDNPGHPDASAKISELAKLERKHGIQCAIVQKGQSVVHEAAHVTTKANHVAYGVATAFGRNMPKTVQLFTGYETTRLNWIGANVGKVGKND